MILCNSILFPLLLLSHKQVDFMKCVRLFFNKFHYTDYFFLSGVDIYCVKLKFSLNSIHYRKVLLEDIQKLAEISLFWCLLNMYSIPLGSSYQTEFVMR